MQGMYRMGVIKKKLKIKGDKGSKALENLESFQTSIYSC